MSVTVEQTPDFIKDFRSSILANDLTEIELQLLGTVATEKRFVKGALIIAEKSNDRDLYLLCEGRVRIERQPPVGCTVLNPKIINVKHGQIFGEVSFLDGTARSASVRAWGNVRVLVLNAEKLERLLQNTPQLGYKIIKNLSRLVCRRLRNAVLLWRTSPSDTLGREINKLDIW